MVVDEEGFIKRWKLKGKEQGRLGGYGYGRLMIPFIPE